MWSNLVFAAFLLATSAGLLGWHVLSWRGVLRLERDEREIAFLRRQYRRRVQASALIGLIGMAVAGGTWVPGPLPAALYWTGVFLAVLWLTLLALADMASSRAHYSKLHSQQLADNAVLKAQLDQLRRRHNNGRK